MYHRYNARLPLPHVDHLQDLCRLDNVQRK